MQPFAGLEDHVICEYPTTLEAARGRPDAQPHRARRQRRDQRPRRARPRHRGQPRRADAATRSTSRSRSAARCFFPPRRRRSDRRRGEGGDGSVKAIVIIRAGTGGTPRRRARSARTGRRAHPPARHRHLRHRCRDLRRHHALLTPTAWPLSGHPRPRVGRRGGRGRPCRRSLQAGRSRRRRMLGRLHGLRHLPRRRLSPLRPPHRDRHPQPERRLRRVHDLPGALSPPHRAIGPGRMRGDGRAGGGRLQRRPPRRCLAPRRGRGLRRRADRPPRRDDGVGLRRGARSRSSAATPHRLALARTLGADAVVDIHETPDVAAALRAGGRAGPGGRDRGDRQPGGGRDAPSPPSPPVGASCSSACSPASAPPGSTSTGW